jgi:lipopolysaccharide/colanic/teichoic acid biosynthesis glycosyltransferase
MISKRLRSEPGSGDGDSNGDGPRIYKLHPDPRVTRVGRVLRRTSLDELPQLINVLRGEMTLVGFRPPIPYEVAEYPAWYHRRFDGRPGITGLWQVSGRNERTYEDMVRLDIEYLNRRNWLFDLWLLVRTVRVVFGGRGAV